MSMLKAFINVSGNENDYAKEMNVGQVFDPIILFQEGEDDQVRYWLGDGWHRLRAFEQNQTQYITVKVSQGDKRDALLYAVGANAKHGLKRTNADKQRAVDIMLLDEEWRQWSDQEISKRVCVDAKTVGNRRKILEKEEKMPVITERTTTRNGKTITTSTKRIGKKKNAEEIDPSNPQNDVAQEEPSQPAPAVEPEAIKDTPLLVDRTSSNGYVEPIPVDTLHDVVDEPIIPTPTDQDIIYNSSEKQIYDKTAHHTDIKAKSQELLDREKCAGDKGSSDELRMKLQETIATYKKEHPALPKEFVQVALSEVWSEWHGYKEVPYAILEQIQGRSCRRCGYVWYIRPKSSGKGWVCIRCGWETDEERILTKDEEFKIACKEFVRKAKEKGY